MQLLKLPVHSCLTQIGVILPYVWATKSSFTKPYFMKRHIFTLLFLAGAVALLSSCSTSKVQQPEYRDIRQVRLVDLGLLTSTAGVDLVYYNPNSFNVQLTDARGDVYIDNVFFGRFDLAEKIDIRKRSEFVVPALIKIDMIGAVKNQQDIFKKKEALIRIDGTARVKKSGFAKEVPIHYEGMQNIERFRTLVSR